MKVLWFLYVIWVGFLAMVNALDGHVVTLCLNLALMAFGSWCFVKEYRQDIDRHTEERRQELRDRGVIT